MNALLMSLLLVAAQAPPERVPWAGSRVRGSPEDPPPFRVEREIPKVCFVYPVDLLAVPGTDLMAAAELSGRVYVFENRPDARSADLIADLNGPLLGIAFHPRFAENGFLFVMAAPGGGSSVGIYRVKVLLGRPLRRSSETPLALLNWNFEGISTHVGGGLRFGPDGCLYIGVGDGSPGGDPRETGQDIRDLESSILRIDVDHPGPGSAYGIPSDNPFAGRPGARPEIWAFGVRQPWKIAFDGERGDLWVGEIGQDLWEAILRVRRGENYGWSVLEGGHPYRPDRTPAPGPIAAPVVTHPHTEFRAVIGGIVYRGARLGDVAGSYIYGDHETGRVWELRTDGNRVLRNRELASTPLRIIAFAEDSRRDLHILNHSDGGLYRLVPNTGAARNAEFPTRLSQTGLFESVKDHRPAAGVVPYEINSPLWSDGAAKERFLALPGQSRVGPDQVPNRYVPYTDGMTWDFPDGTVLVKTFSLGGRRVETRLLHLEKFDKIRDSFNPSPDIRHQVWHGYSYQWNEAQTDAELVDAAGRDVETPVRDGSGALRRQVWHFPSRNQCVQCHSMAAHFVLGVTTPQLNREVDVAGVGKMNQLQRFWQLGMLDRPLRRHPSLLPRLVDVADESQSLELRARSYLHANCAHCHVYLGGGNSEFLANILTPLNEAKLVDVPPLHGGLGLDRARLVAPFSPERSVVIRRMGLLGEGRMPPLASTVVDTQAVDVLSRWVRQLPPPAAPSYGTEWALASMIIVLLAGQRLQSRKKRRG